MFVPRADHPDLPEIDDDDARMEVLKELAEIANDDERRAEIMDEVRRELADRGVPVHLV